MHNCHMSARDPFPVHTISDHTSVLAKWTTSAPPSCRTWRSCLANINHEHLRCSAPATRHNAALCKTQQQDEKPVKPIYARQMQDNFAENQRMRSCHVTSQMFRDPAARQQCCDIVVSGFFSRRGQQLASRTDGGTG
jgi:hypothetical protein